MTRSLLVALDYAGCAHEVVEQAADYAGRLGLDVVLFHAVTLPNGVAWATPVGESIPIHTAEEVLLEDAKTALGNFARVFEHRGIGVTVETPLGDPVESVVARAERDDIELVMMGTHGRRGLERFVLGSVCERVLRQAPRPVMVVRSQQLEGHPGVTPLHAAVEAEADG